MEKQTAPHFDWIAWHATIPGIPAGWGVPPPILTEPVDAVAFQPADLDIWPELKAA